MLLYRAVSSCVTRANLVRLSGSSDQAVGLSSSTPVSVLLFAITKREVYRFFGKTLPLHTLLCKTQRAEEYGCLPSCHTITYCLQIFSTLLLAFLVLSVIQQRLKKHGNIYSKLDRPHLHGSMKCSQRRTLGLKYLPSIPNDTSMLKLSSSPNISVELTCSKSNIAVSPDPTDVELLP